MKQIDRCLQKRIKKAASLVKDELGQKINEKSAGLQPKTCSYLKENNGEGKKAKGTKKVCCKNKP